MKLLKYMSIQNKDQEGGQNVCCRLSPDKTGLTKHRLQNEQSRNVDQTLSADIDNQRFTRRAHGLQGVAVDIEDAKQKACGQQYSCKADRIGISTFICQKRTDNLTGKQKDL